MLTGKRGTFRNRRIEPMIDTRVSFKNIPSVFKCPKNNEYIKTGRGEWSLNAENGMDLSAVRNFQGDCEIDYLFKMSYESWPFISHKLFLKDEKQNQVFVFQK